VVIIVLVYNLTSLCVNDDITHMQNRLNVLYTWSNTWQLIQADRTSRFDLDSPGLECDVPVSRKGTFGTHLCPGLKKAVLVGTEGISCALPVLSAQAKREVTQQKQYSTMFELF